jgi:hypothetical protein
MTDNKTETVENKLSYSSATLLKNCSQKYYYYKVAGLSKDDDAEVNEEAFNIGKCFHWVLEETRHTDDLLVERLVTGCKTYEVEAHQGMIHAMLLRYLRCHQTSGLKVRSLELGISNDIFVGYIDAIMVDPITDKWWIVDLKTAARASEITFARLATDTQLNLYASFADDIALLLGLDRGNFAGTRYRVTTKSKLKRKATESYDEHVIRTAKNVQSYDVIIPVDVMNPSKAYEDHERLYNKSMDLRIGVAKPERNLSYCDSFFKPCEYWSQCHGATFSKCKGSLEMITENV